MIKITKKKFDAISSDYKGKWSAIGGTMPEWIGKRTVLTNCILPKGAPHKNSLSIEGVDFEVVS